MILISTVFKSSKTWGTYYCEVFEVCNDPNNINKFISINLTKWYAQKFWLLYKNNVIQISYWSWTGFNVLKQLLIEWTWIDSDQVIDVSVYF